MTVEEARRFFGESPARCALARNYCATSGWDICDSVSRPPSFPAARPSASSSSPSCSAQQRGATLYVIDEPTIGLHPADVDKLMLQLNALVDAGNTVIVAEHDMRVAAGGDWLIDMGPGAGDLGGRVVATGTPAVLAAANRGRTAPDLAEWLHAEGMEPA